MPRAEPTPSPGHPPYDEPLRAPAVWGWMAFDFAAQPFFTVVLTFVFGPYFVSQLAPDPASGQTAWPMAATIADAERMAEVVTRTGIPYATAYDQRFHGAHRMIARLVADGVLGAITQGTIRYACWLPEGFAPVPGHDNWRIDPARAGGGAVIDLAPHGIDLVASLTGARPLRVSAVLQHAVQPYALRETGAVDDGGVVTVSYENGVLASISLAYNCPDALPRRRLELIGTRGSLVAVDTMGQTAGGTLTLHGADGHSRALAIEDDRPPFEVQVEAFGRMVRGDVHPMFASAEDDLSAHKLLIEALDTARSKVSRCR